jgi:hypothetical protein
VYAGFSKVAPYLSNPLVLIGFALLLFFGVHRTLVKSRLLSPVNPTASNKIVRLLLHYGFVVALLLVFLGFGFAAWTSYLSAGSYSKEKQRPAPTNDAEVSSEVFLGWDNDDTKKCRTFIATHELEPFANDFYLYVACVDDEPTIDLANSKTLEFSAPFQITGQQQEIDIVYSGVMKTISARSRTAHVVFLLPKTTRISALNTLSDIAKNHGKILIHSRTALQGIPPARDQNNTVDKSRPASTRSNSTCPYPFRPSVFFSHNISNNGVSAFGSQGEVQKMTSDTNTNNNGSAMIDVKELGTGSFDHDTTVGNASLLRADKAQQVSVTNSTAYGSTAYGGPSNPVSDPTFTVGDWFEFLEDYEQSVVDKQVEHSEAIARALRNRLETDWQTLPVNKRQANSKELDTVLKSIAGRSFNPNYRDWPPTFVSRPCIP